MIYSTNCILSKYIFFLYSFSIDARVSRSRMTLNICHSRHIIFECNVTVTLNNNKYHLFISFLLIFFHHFKYRMQFISKIRFLQKNKNLFYLNREFLFKLCLFFFNYHLEGIKMSRSLISFFFSVSVPFAYTILYEMEKKPNFREKWIKILSGKI